ncbi:hypothetical protein RUM43_008951 [Polyplax serrata]|uniref:Uncharacterized protein n=1 Tax=Polyplax serrata TaxID=468196 RepID=A0AAN8PVP7_POLSC
MALPSHRHKEKTKMDVAAWGMRKPNVSPCPSGINSNMRQSVNEERKRDVHGIVAAQHFHVGFDHHQPNSNQTDSHQHHNGRNITSSGSLILRVDRSKPNYPQQTHLNEATTRKEKEERQRQGEPPQRDFFFCRRLLFLSFHRQFPTNEMCRQFPLEETPNFPQAVTGITRETRGRGRGGGRFAREKSKRVGKYGHKFSFEFRGKAEEEEELS